MRQVESICPEPAVDNDFESLMDLPWSRELVPDGSTIAARITELPGCFSEGRNFEEALANLQDALEMWIESSLELGNEIPNPLDRTELEPEPSFSGRFSVRMPKTLHRQLFYMANDEGCSINQLVVTILAEKVGNTSSERR